MRGSGPCLIHFPFRDRIKGLYTLTGIAYISAVKSILLIGLGSFIGGVLRHLLSCCLNDSVVKGFPLGTLAVNLAGCFLLGVLYGFFDRGALINQELRIFLTIGLCGGFTTFSTFMNENFLMAQGAQFFTLLLYAVLSLGGGFLTLWLGYTLLKAA